MELILADSRNKDAEMADSSSGPMVAEGQEKTRSEVKRPGHLYWSLDLAPQSPAKVATVPTDSL